MDIRKLVTLTFDKNVGPTDRVFRLVSGATLALGPWALALPLWASALLSVLGVMWTMTAVLSRCSIYYLLGYSTCPLRFLTDETDLSRDADPARRTPPAG